MRALPRQHDDLCFIVLLERSKDRPQFLAHLQVKAIVLLRARHGYSANLVFVLDFHGFERPVELANSASSDYCIATSRPAERRVGKEIVSQCRSWWSTHP